MEHLKENQVEDIVLIKNVKEKNCSESLAELINRHAGICDTVARKYSGLSRCSGVAFEDFFENHKYIIYEATKDYDDSFGTKFVTWVGNKMRFYCLNTLLLNFYSNYYHQLLFMIR
jgi:hypothetical protein